MRRREAGARPATPEGMVALWSEAKADAAVLFNEPEQRRRYVNAVLAERGVDVVDVIRARRTLRARR